ncbi:cystathionine gamma-lyase [Longispora urticae]
MEYRDGTLAVRAGLPEPVPGQPFLPGPVFAGPYHLDPVTGPAAAPDAYGRETNPTLGRLESAIAELEGAAGCLVFANGMAAVSAAMLALTRPGDAVTVPADGYFGVRLFADADLVPRGIGVRAVPTDAEHDFTGVRLALLETPANPSMAVCDLDALSAQAHAAGALVAVDNTMATPLGQRPLDLGADLVVASGTKALTGHSDLLLGYVATNDPDLLATLRSWRSHTGGLPGPFEAWLAHRSLGTLDLRLARQSANAAAVHGMLAKRPEVTNLRWPGTDPVALRQMRRIPGVMSFELPDAAHVGAFLTHSALVHPATSFGGLHTTADRRAQWGENVPEGLVRLSCGCEDVDDLLADLAAALDRAAG